MSAPPASPPRLQAAAPYGTVPIPVSAANLPDRAFSSDRRRGRDLPFREFAAEQRAGSLGPLGAVAAQIAPVARKILHRRAMRLTHFGPSLAQDAVWNMLLELLVARLDHSSVSIKCLWVASGLPATTALRWVKYLEESGHVVRRNDPSDGRRQLMALEDGLALRIMEFLRATES